MQTFYYKTSNFIQHSSNVVDLERFRQNQALAQQDSLARRFEPEGRFQEEAGERDRSAFRPVVLTTTPAQRRRAHRERQAWKLDVCASLSIILMTMIFALLVIL